MKYTTAQHAKRMRATYGSGVNVKSKRFKWVYSPLLEGPMTISEIAAISRISTKLVKYHIQALLCRNKVIKVGDVTYDGRTRAVYEIKNCNDYTPIN